jgi:hypothetical protein
MNWDRDKRRRAVRRWSSDPPEDGTKLQRRFASSAAELLIAQKKPKRSIRQQLKRAKQRAKKQGHIPDLFAVNARLKGVAEDRQLLYRIEHMPDGTVTIGRHSPWW